MSILFSGLKGVIVFDRFIVGFVENDSELN